MRRENLKRIIQVSFHGGYIYKLLESMPIYFSTLFLQYISQYFCRTQAHNWGLNLIISSSFSTLEDFLTKEFYKCFSLFGRWKFVLAKDFVAFRDCNLILQLCSIALNVFLNVPRLWLWWNEKSFFLANNFIQPMLLWTNQSERLSECESEHRFFFKYLSII